MKYDGGGEGRVTSDEIVPNPAEDPLTRGDDDDVERPSYIQQDKHIIECKKLNYTFLEAMISPGMFTSGYTVAFCHKDAFSKNTDGNIIENKVEGILGDPDTRRNLQDYISGPNKGRMPPGSLGFVRYKVATVAGAMNDVQLHVLFNDMHLGPRHCANGVLSTRRGAWFIPPGGDWKHAVFYPEGFALLDWESRNGG